VNIGAENRTKTIVAVVLMLGAVLFLARNALNPAPKVPVAAPANPQAATDQADAANRPRQRTRTAQRAGANPSPLAPTLDPRLKLSLLKASEDTVYAGTGRNIFRAEPEPVHIPKPVQSAVKTPPVNPGPPPPPPINLKFFGFASKPGEPKKVFLSEGEDVFIAGEGDIVNRRYKITRIGPTSIEVEDVLNNNRQAIPLTQG
jgi:hypothetical protein